LKAWPLVHIRSAASRRNGLKDFPSILFSGTRQEVGSSDVIVITRDACATRRCAKRVDSFLQFWVKGMLFYAFHDREFKPRTRIIAIAGFL
jgi:hypothetical protein